MTAYNINSNNFFCRGEKESVLVKIITKNKIDIENLNDMYELFSKTSLPVPQSIKNDKGEIFTELDKNLIQIIKFIKGRYFIGGETDISKSAKAIARLSEICIELPSKHFPDAPLFPENPDKIIDETFKKSASSLIKNFGQELTQILLNNKIIIYESINYIINQKIKEHETFPMHIDLHPHNILITTDEAVIIDLDSICNVNIERSLGFGYFKLLRQDIANKSHGENSKKIMEDILNTTKYGHIFDPLKSYSSVKKEIMRRLLLILNENLLYGVSKWNQVLKIQINSLNEIDHLFMQN